MKPNHLYINPSHGWADGVFSFGACAGTILETDIIDAYCASLAEELYTDGIFHTVLNTRDNPGLSTEQRIELTNDHCALITLCAPKNTKRNQSWKNEGKIYIGTPASKDLAELIAFAITKWGKATTNLFGGVKIMDSSAFPILSGPAPINIIIQPFMLDCADAVKLAARSEALGKAIACAIIPYLRSLNPMVGIRLANR